MPFFLEKYTSQGLNSKLKKVWSEMISNENILFPQIKVKRSTRYTKAARLIILFGGSWF